jgi:hypothetical protein
MEWGDIAGRVDAAKTLWTWAWSRFPVLENEQFGGIDETHELRVTLKNGKALVGFPDQRKSEGGRLVLLLTGGSSDAAPISIDDIASVERL